MNGSRTPLKPLPIWASIVIVMGVTLLAYWFLGGEHYLSHKSEIDYTLFHHPEDDSNPYSWIGLFLETGACSAFVALILSTIAAIILHKRNQQS